MFDMLSPAGLPKLTLLSRTCTHTHIQREATQKTERHTIKELEHAHRWLNCMLVFAQTGHDRPEPHVFDMFVV